MALERLLTAARRMSLRTALNQDGPKDKSDTMLAFCSALAQQCFINEYVFYVSHEELGQAHKLRDLLVAALESGAVVHPFWIALVAAYFPLSSVPLSGRLLDMAWPAGIEAILTQQIREPEEDGRLRKAIPKLTRIEDAVSRSVQTQYEENPYPRWVEAGAAGAPEALTVYLRQKFPFATVENIGSDAGVEILVAGCGTGRNAIETTQRFKGARTLAVDLSLNSLGYAARKSRGPIDYAQADLLELGTMERRFDLIEAVGVLHHLTDPFAGWRLLSSLLKPGGAMLVGLYSATARRNLPDMHRIASDGPGADEIRQVRRRLTSDDDQPELVLHPDFFSVSSCRDLLFHVQEQFLSLDAIGAFLRGSDLKFIGFSIDDAVLAAYRQRFPGDPGAADLDHWQQFEADNPDTFSGMYQFWLQKAL
jgi:SAM-dependent methyltransferase